MTSASERRPTGLSVVIPTYRRGRSLGRTVERLSAQRGVALEIIVVDQNAPGFLDDALPATTRARFTRLAQLEPNAAAARNRGFAAARHDLVLFIDDDLLPAPTFCAQALAALAARPDVECLVPVVHAPGERDAAKRRYRQQRRGAHPRDPALWRLSWTMSAAVFFTRRCFRRSGGFDEHLFRYARASEDHELFLRMGARGLALWLDTGLSIEHDEGVPGGAELRRIPAQENRERSVRAWTFKAWTHSGSTRYLRPRQLGYLLRNALVNRRTLSAGPWRIWREARLLTRCLRESRRAAAPLIHGYRDLDRVDHLAPYLGGGPA